MTGNQNQRDGSGTAPISYVIKIFCKALVLRILHEGMSNIQNLAASLIFRMHRHEQPTHKVSRKFYVGIGANNS